MFYYCDVFGYSLLEDNSSIDVDVSENIDVYTSYERPTGHCGIYFSVFRIENRNGRLKSRFAIAGIIISRNTREKESLRKFCKHNAHTYAAV